MKWKSFLCASVSLAGLAMASPSLAQTSAPAGEPVPPVADTPATTQPVEDDTGDEGEVVVSGLRRSLETAATIKRKSEGIVDAVVAEDIGKLPDTFASSALQRVAGVGVTRGGGESAGVTVRGLPDLTTTYNGRQIFTAEGRFVAIQDFPAGTVAALEVYKSGVANQIEGGIAGAVNVRGRKPFDFKGFELSGSLNGVYSEQAQKGTWNGNLLISDRWDTGIGEMGFLLNASYVGIKFLDSTREQSLVIGTTDNVNAPGRAGLRFPDAQGNFLGYGDRFRPSVNAAFQWKPTPELEIYADGIFQGFRSKDYNRWMFIPIFGGLTFSNITTIPNTNKIATATVTGAVRPDGFTGSYNGKTDTYQGGGGFIWNRDRLKISGDVAYTDSTFTLDGVNVDYAAASSPVRNVNFDASHDGGPTQNFVNFNLNDPANFISRGLYQEYLVVSGSDWQARTDLSYDFGDGILRRVDVGVRYADRKAGRDFGNFYVNNEGANIPMTSLPGAVLRATLPGFAYNNVQPNRTYAAITRNSIRDNLPELRAFFGTPAGRPAFNPTDNFRANEKSYAAYGQVKYGFDLGNVVVDGLVGLRAVKTKTEINGFSRIDNGGGVITNPAVTANSSYTDYLPNVSSRIAFTDKVQLRLAYTQTRTRPGFFDLRPNLTLGQPVVFPVGSPCLNPASAEYATRACARFGSQGNPDLRPLTSNNYDASFEWYFSRTGSFTAAIFRHDADGFLVTNNTVSGTPGVSLVAIDRPENLGKVRLDGAEVSFVSFLDIDGIPEWMKGFGIQANGTYIKGRDADNDRPFQGVSKWAGNLIALYERPQFSARLAYNYRSKFVTNYTLEALDPDVHGIIEKARGQVDFSTSITPVPNITVAFDIVNLLGNPLQRYRQYNTVGDSFARQILYLERSYSLGVRFRF